MPAAARPRKRRSPGEGSVWPYRTKGGQERWAIGYVLELPDGTRKSVTRRRGVHGERWTDKRSAQAALRAVLADAAKGEHVDPSRQQLGAYLAEWLDGLRLAPSTVASYRKNIRLHVQPYIGAVPLASLTTARIDSLYRQLERSGRADHRQGEGLSARTVRYIHTILSAALGAAVKAHRLPRNPAAEAAPPSAKEAKPPEMHPWTAAQLSAFLAWTAENSPLHPLWFLYAYTGMRRGEALALRWRDIDLGAGTVSVRRSVGVIRNRGQGATVAEGPTKTNKPRVVDLDAATVAVLRAWFKARGSMALQLVQAGALVFGDHEGRHLHPERVSRTFKATVERCRKALGAAAPPMIRLHDLRHTHATILLADRENVKVVSERLGHASVTVTLTVYAHVMPGNQRQAADRFAALIEGAKAQ
jgi:integrase